MKILISSMDFRPPPLEDRIVTRGGNHWDGGGEKGTRASEKYARERAGLAHNPSR